MHRYHIEGLGYIVGFILLFFGFVLKHVQEKMHDSTLLPLEIIFMSSGALLVFLVSVKVFVRCVAWFKK